MNLPKIDLPTYTMKLASSKKDIQFRPFLVKEEKVLLLALESGDFNEILAATKQMIRNCVLSDINVEQLPLFEIEHIFLNIRARSMGETISLGYTCQTNVSDNDDVVICGNQMPVNVNLLEAKLNVVDDNMTIMLDSTTGIKLKYPTINISSILNDSISEADSAIAIIEQCTDYLFDSDQVYKPEDMQEGEFVGFVEGLTQYQFNLIQNFFNNLPKVEYDTEVVCSRCNTQHKIHLEGSMDFFE